MRLNEIQNIWLMNLKHSEEYKCNTVFSIIIPRTGENKFSCFALRRSRSWEDLGAVLRESIKESCTITSEHKSYQTRLQIVEMEEEKKRKKNSDPHVQSWKRWISRLGANKVIKYTCEKFGFSFQELGPLSTMRKLIFVKEKR